MDYPSEMQQQMDQDAEVRRQRVMIVGGVSSTSVAMLRRLQSQGVDVIVPNRSLDPMGGTYTRTYSAAEIERNERQRQTRERDAWNRDVESKKAERRRAKEKA